MEDPYLAADPYASCPSELHGEQLLQPTVLGARQYLKGFFHVQHSSLQCHLISSDTVKSFANRKLYNESL